MKLNKPLITIFLIILLVINLIFFCFLSIGNNLSSKEYVNKIVENFNFKEYLLNNSIFKDSIDNYKYPKEVFNYLDDIKIDKLKEDIINNLFDKKDYLVDKNEIVSILSNSVHEYELNRKTDIYSYVEEDINNVAINLDERINNDLLNGYSYVIGITKTLFLVSIIISVAIISIIIILEKEIGIIISSIILIVYSFFVFYFNKYFLDFGFKNILKYFDKVSLDLDGLYLLSFVVGVIFLLIYLIKKAKKIARDIRINSYNSR